MSMDTLKLIIYLCLGATVGVATLALGQPAFGGTWLALLTVSLVSYVLGYLRGAAEYDPKSPFKED